MAVGGNALRTDIGALVNPGIESLPDSSTVLDAAALMDNREIGSVIVTIEGEAAGVFTERDLLRLFALGSPPSSIELGSAMSSPIISIDHRADLVEGMELMDFHAIRHVVVNDGGSQIAILSDRNLITHAGRVLEIMESISPEHEIKPPGIAANYCSNITTMEPDCDLHDAARALELASSECLIDLLGPGRILTSRDILHALASAADPGELAEPWTSTPLLRCRGTDTLASVATMMSGARVRHMLVNVANEEPGVLFDRQLLGVLPRLARIMRRRFPAL